MGTTAEHPSPDFPTAALPLLRDVQLRGNVRHATDVIQEKRFRVVSEMSDWQALRDAGRNIRAHTLAYLDTYLEQFEQRCIDAGGQVHWARDAAEGDDAASGHSQAGGRARAHPSELSAAGRQAQCRRARQAAEEHFRPQIAVRR